MREFTLNRGYSLIELLVVLSLVSLITAIAMPNLVKFYENFSDALTLDDVIGQVNGIGYKVYENGSAYTLNDLSSDSTSVAAISIPNGWEIDVQKPIEYLPNGSCRGGKLKIFYQGTPRLTSSLSTPYCQIAQ